MINHPSWVKRSWGGFLSSLAGIKLMCWINCIPRAGAELHAMVYLIPQAGLTSCDERLDPRAGTNFMR